MKKSEFLTTNMEKSQIYLCNFRFQGSQVIIGGFVLLSSGHFGLELGNLCLNFGHFCECLWNVKGYFVPMKKMVENLLG